MIKILANDGLHADGLLLLSEAGYQVDTHKVAQEDLPTILPEYDAIIVRSATKVRQPLLDACPNLRLIVRAGVGLDNIDVDYARSKGVQVFNTPQASAQSVAELVFAHLLSLSRSLHLSHRDMAERGRSEFRQIKKAYSKGRQLSGKTLGIVGFGRIGRAVARIGWAFGMKVIATDLTIHSAEVNMAVSNYEEVKLTIQLETHSIEEVLAKSDFLTLHVPFSGDRPLIGETEIQQMKPGAMLINTARGGAVDEAALLAALDSGHLAGAGLDVFVGEPEPGQTLLGHPKVSVSPHIGASTVEAQANIGREAAEQILTFFGAVSA